MRVLTLTLLGLPLLAQTPTPAPTPGTVAFFKQSRDIVLKTCAERARDLNPKSTRILAELGNIQLALGDLKVGGETLQSAADAAPLDGDTCRIIGSAWLRHGDLPQALKAFAEMERREPTDRGNFAEAALDLLSCGHPTEALRYMEKAWVLGPKSQRMLGDFGVALLEANRKVDANRFLELAFSADPKDEELCERIAMKMMDLGDAEGTTLWMERFYLSDRKEFDHEWIKCLRYGRMLYQKGLTDAAFQWFERACRANPREEHVWMDIASLMAEGKPATPSVTPPGPSTPATGQ